MYRRVALDINDPKMVKLLKAFYDLERPKGIRNHWVFSLHPLPEHPSDAVIHIWNKERKESFVERVSSLILLQDVQVKADWILQIFMLGFVTGFGRIFHRLEQHQLKLEAPSRWSFAGESLEDTVKVVEAIQATLYRTRCYDLEVSMSMGEENRDERRAWEEMEKKLRKLGAVVTYVPGLQAIGKWHAVFLGQSDLWFELLLQRVRKCKETATRVRSDARLFTTLRHRHTVKSLHSRPSKKLRCEVLTSY